MLRGIHCYRLFHEHGHYLDHNHHSRIRSQTLPKPNLQDRCHIACHCSRRKLRRCKHGCKHCQDAVAFKEGQMAASSVSDRDALHASSLC